MAEAGSSTDGGSTSGGVSGEPCEGERGDVPRSKYKAPLTTSALLASLSACFGTISEGTVLSYTTPAMADILNTKPFAVSEKDASWAMAISCLGSLLGALCSAFLVDLVGRKLGMMLTVLPFVGGWIIVAASGNINTFLLGQFVLGASKMIMLCMVYVYIAEIAPANTRGMLMTSGSVGYSLGQLFESCFGTLVHWNWLAILSAVLPVMMLCLMYFMPESPRYLALKGYEDEAGEMLLYLRGNDRKCYPGELEKILRLTLEEPATKENQSCCLCWKQLLKAEVLKPLGIILALFSFQQLSGNNILWIYTVSSCAMYGGSMMDTNVQMVILGLVGVAGALCSLALIDYVGRKPLLLTSTFVMAFSMAAAGAYFFEDHEYADSHLYWLPLVSLVFSNFFFSIAYKPIPWIFATELFATRTRGRIISICGFWQSLCNFLVLKYFIHLNKYLQFFGVLWLCGGLCVCSTIFVVFFLPETKRKSLEKAYKDFHKKYS